MLGYLLKVCSCITLQYKIKKIPHFSTQTLRLLYIFSVEVRHRKYRTCSIYAPFVYKPPLPFCANLLRRYIYLQFKLTTEELCDSDEREEGWNSPYHPI